MTVRRRVRDASNHSGPGYQPMANPDPIPPPPPPRTRVRAVPPVAVAKPAQTLTDALETIAKVPVQPVSNSTVPRAWQTVHRAWYRGKQFIAEDFKEEAIEVPVFTGPVGHVAVAGGVTRNMGDFNNVKVYVSVSLPCYPEDTEVRRAFMHASTLIDELLPSELDKAMGVDNPQG